MQNARFTTHGARIGATTTKFAETKDVNAIKLTGGWKSQSSTEQYIRNGSAAIAALDIKSESQSRIMRAAEKFTNRVNRYLANHDLTLVTHVNENS